jgi:3-deoxy-7-phosphoheptulonate synthase
VLKEQTHLPVVIDPSHATGHASLVPSMCYAAAAAGADGLIVEVHPHPEIAASDGPQSLRPPEFTAMMSRLREFVAVTGKTL